MLVTGSRPRNDVEPLKGNLTFRVLAETELLGRLNESLERRVNFAQLARDARRVRLIKLLVEGVGAEIGRMERNNRQISSFLLLARTRTLDDDAVQ